MKKILIFILVIAVSLLSISRVSALVEYDLINEYDISIVPNDNATLNMSYHIKWTVLEDENGKEPLTWVKIGVPNSHVKNIKALSSNISSCSYYDDDGAFIRVDFKKSYYKGETLDFSFEFVQERIFTLNGDYVEFNFMPGWFNEIRIENLTLKWYKNINIDYIDPDKYSIEEDEYYLFNATNLNYGETIDCPIRYDKISFPNINERKGYISYEKEESIKGAIVFAAVFVFVVVILFLVQAYNRTHSDGYECYSGYSGHWLWYYSWYRPRRGYNKEGSIRSTGSPVVVNSSSSSHHSSSGGSSCACACACACAGGGRAGCSRKDFYKNINTEEVIEALKKDTIYQVPTRDLDNIKD